MSEDISIAEVAGELQNHDNFLILTHKSPDGDTLGCASALTRALQGMGKHARFVNSDEIPEKYAFLYRDIPVEEFEPEYIVAVDIADTTLLGDSLSVYADKVDLCIDHHVSNRRFAKKLHLNPNDGAASLTLYRIFTESGIPITEEMACDLYTGLTTDTGCFRYSNANADAYRAAAGLIECGADNGKINELMFETKPMSYYRLVQRTLSEMRMYCDSKVVVFKITQEMLRETGATEDQCDAICAMSRTIEGVEAGITMKQKTDGRYKFSLRTRESLDASEICRPLGGGGHVRAAGCDAGTEEEEALRTMLEFISGKLQVAI